MRFLARRQWFHQVWRHKTSILGGALAIGSLSLGHYAGFLANVPLQIVAVAGLRLATGVTATFLFYVFFCAVTARVLISMLQLIVLPLFTATDRLERGFGRKMNWSQRRRFVRRHWSTIKWEGMAWLFVQAALFLFSMLAIYVKFTATWFSVVGIVLAIALATLSGLFRAAFFLQPEPQTFIRKIKQRPARFARATSAAFVTSTGALIILAFILGSMRASLLRDQNPNMVVTKDFRGLATVIASSDSALLLYQKHQGELRYIYSSPEFTTSMETKPVFPPLGDKATKK